MSNTGVCEAYRYSLMYQSKYENRIGDVMVSMIVHEFGRSWFEPQSGQNKDYKICI